MAHPVEPLNNLLQRREKQPTVQVVVENSLAPITARSDVVKRIRKRYADRTGHAGQDNTGHATKLDLTPFPSAGQDNTGHATKLDLTPFLPFLFQKNGFPKEPV